MTAKQIITKTAVNIGRLLVAVTFIFSGFVKGMDPLGTQYKITDYLEALHIDWMFPDWSTLVMSVLLATAEFAIGIFLLFAIRRRLTSKITLAVMIVMTLITLWIVIADPVKDCGCFGDAVVLTNMETFIKNIILLIFAILLWKKPLEMPRLISRQTQWVVQRRPLCCRKRNELHAVVPRQLFDTGLAFLSMLNDAHEQFLK